MTLTNALLVALGAAVGAPLRYLVNHGIRARFGGTPAAGTLVVNVVGSFVLGVVVGAAASPGSAGCSPAVDRAPQDSGVPPARVSGRHTVWFPRHRWRGRGQWVLS